LRAHDPEKWEPIFGKDHAQRKMTMSDSTRSDMTASPRMPGGPLPRFDTPLVPRNSISGRALVAVVAIMTFLAR
jgi:hypothetical protein